VKTDDVIAWFSYWIPIWILMFVVGITIGSMILFILHVIGMPDIMCK
jgi:ABC-type multidrug transport system permease subunit